MNSARKRDRLVLFIKRGALEEAVQKCGADFRRSLETFKVRTPIIWPLLILTTSVEYASG
jgi:hypothetical protein